MSVLPERVRRRHLHFIAIRDEVQIDLKALLAGSPQPGSCIRIELLCPITGKRIALGAEELGLLCEVPADRWSTTESLLARLGVSAALLAGLVERGLLLAADVEGSHGALEAEDARLGRSAWHPISLLYHAMSAWSGISSDDPLAEKQGTASPERLRRHIANHGPAPEQFWRHPQGASRTWLKDDLGDSALAELCMHRSTSRAFCVQTAIAKDVLARLLRLSFGMLGVREIAPGLSAGHKLSPSGGGLHPIEAFVVCLNVEGLASGLYHYECGAHALSAVKLENVETLRSRMTELLTGQSFFADAAVIIFQAARSSRNYWKYRRHAKAYKVLFTDAGHLSQTWYLACASEGLGAFYTGAINDRDFCAWAELDPAEFVVIGANGSGKVEQADSPLHLNAERLVLDARP